MISTRKGGLTIFERTLLTCVLLASCASAFALDPSLDISQYAHTSWKIRDGFTKGTIYSIAQTPDGYLWLGTNLGLLRFDGIRNVPWQPPSDQPLPSSNIFNLLAARDSTLWIGTDKGLASWNRGKLTKYPETAGQFIFALMEDSHGVVWVGVGTLPAGKLCAISNGSVQCYGDDGTFGRGPAGLYEDRKGNLWVGVQNGLWRWKPGPPQFFSLPGETIARQNLAEDLDGVLLIGLTSGIRRLVDGKPEPYPLPSSIPQFRGGQMLRDREGSLWIGTSIGVVHLHRGITDVFSPSDGLSGDIVGNLFEDREGNIWATTPNGLDRFRDFAVPTFSVGQGLSSPVVSVLAVSDGSVFLATGGGLNRWSNGQFSRYGGSARPPGSTGTTDVPNSLFQDSRGRIWMGTRREFGYLENHRFIPIKGVPGGGIRSIAEDATGNLWIANQDAGLIQLSQGRMMQQTPWIQTGHKDFASSLIVDPVQGGLWLGFFQGGLAHFKDSKVQKAYTAADGLGEGFVSDLRLDPDGTLWAATANGLSRLKNDRITTLTSKNGLPCDGVLWLMDNNEAFWLHTTCGLVRIARAELARWTAAVDQFKDAKRTIQATVFDISDGVRSRDYPIGLTHQVAWSRDGKLWFPAYDGVYVLDPNRLAFNKLPPPVHIEQIIADRKPYDVTEENNGSLRLPALSRDLQIDYTALSLVAPEKIRFRYQLEGYDRDWQDAGNRRQAFYTNLPPRNYRFRVMACNNSGVWNEAGSFIDFTIAPAYYQTTWFRILLVVAVLLVLFALYRLRVRQVAQQVRAGMEGRLDERERIARDLHDTLLQSVQGLILKFHAGIKQIPPEIQARQTMERALDHADQVLAEGRDRVRNLRATAVSIDDLPVAFKSVATETLHGRNATFKTVVEGSVRQLHPLVQEESYCIGREAIVNALTHSGGHNVEVEITYETRQFRLRVRDDGNGIEPRILEEGGRSDHWGMQGMRERANKIGAELKIWSGHGTGTEVELTVPGATAYQIIAAKPKRSWFNRVSGADS